MQEDAIDQDIINRRKDMALKNDNRRKHWMDKRLQRGCRCLSERKVGSALLIGKTEAKAEAEQQATARNFSISVARHTLGHSQSSFSMNLT